MLVMMMMFTYFTLTHIISKGIDAKQGYLAGINDVEMGWSKHGGVD